MAAESRPDPYRWLAPWYDRLVEPFNAPLRRIGLRMYPVGAGMDVLDAGCGTGVHLSLYAEAGATCFGVDLSPAMLEQARRRLGDAAEVRLASVAQLPFPDARFDLVLAALFLHELDDVARLAAMGEIKRTLRPGGRVLAIDYHAAPIGRLKGRVWRGFTHVVERAAGRPHHRAFRRFLAGGGVPALAAAAGLEVAEARVVSGGNMGLYLLAHRDRVAVRTERARPQPDE